MTVDELKTELAQLSTDDRAELAEFLVDTLDATEPEVDPDWVAELERRAEEIKSGREVGIPADVVFERLRKKYP